MRKSLLALIFPLGVFVVSCSNSNSQVKSNQTHNQTKVEKKVDLCSDKIVKEFIPQGNEIVYKGKEEGACRVLTFNEKLMRWFPVVIYQGQDGKVHGVYGSFEKNGTPYISQAEKQAVDEFINTLKQRYMAWSIQQLKTDFKQVAVIGNGTQTAYFLLLDEREWEKFKDKILSKLQPVSDMVGLKILVLAPKDMKKLYFKFKLPFHLVFMIKDGKVVKTNYFVDIPPVF
jgi:hypothetical protein